MIGDTHRFKIGAFDCIIFCDMAEHFPASNIFPSIPTDQLEGEMHTYGYDAAAIGFSMNILLIETPQGRVLVDTGLDRKQDLPNSLKAAGIEVDSIKHVILTHPDGDHIGGLAYTEGNLTYPNAHYTISKGSWEFGLSEAQKSENPNLIARRSLSAIKDNVDVVEGETEVVPGVHLIPAPGHRAGHSAVLVESQGEKLLHIVDAAHNPIQVVHPEWSMRADAQPEVASETRRALFEQANAENLLVMAYHFPFPGLGHIVKENDHLVWQPLQV